MRESWKKYREAVMYLLFGALTTLVNYVIYFLFTRLFSWNYMPATVISWIGAVVFAFFTNRRFVFASKKEKPSEIGGEFAKFVGGRVFSLFLEMGIMYLGVDILQCKAFDWAVKTVAQIGVIFFNYFLSKWFVFTNS